MSGEGETRSTSPYIRISVIESLSGIDVVSAKSL
jgi:hypothetical protein